MDTNSKFIGFSDVDGSENPERFVDCLNEQHAKDSVLRFNKQRTLELVDLRDGLVVLDAGCGVGFDAIQMASQVGQTGQEK